MIDIAIIGGGPAGLTASIYASRGGAKTVVFERLTVGGQASITSEIENFPAFTQIEGYQLGLRLAEQAEHFGAEIVYDEVTSIDLATKTIWAGKEYKAKCIILAMGASPRRLGLVSEQRFAGRGVSYCATCDGNFYKGKRVAVCGGGNTAVEDALYLSELASEVYIIHRRNEFRAEQVLVDKMQSVSNIKMVLNSVVSGIEGDKKVNGLQVKAVDSDKTLSLDVDALFVAVGNIPNSTLVEGQVEMSNGYIVVDACKRTSVLGVYAVGDVTNTVLRQVITACADGAIASSDAIKAIKEL